MIRFRIRKKGFEKGKKKVLNKYQKILRRSMLTMEEIALRKAPFFQGKLREGISLFPQILADKYFLVSSAKYSADLEFGNTPRNVPLAPLIKWVKLKGIRTDERIFPFALAVQEKIKKEGVNPHPFMRPALHEVKEIWLIDYAKEEFSKVNE